MTITNTNRSWYMLLESLDKSVYKFPMLISLQAHAPPRQRSHGPIVDSVSYRSCKNMKLTHIHHIFPESYKHHTSHSLSSKNTMALPTASAEHTRKRQYQLPIHSFFQRNASTSAGSGSSSPSHSISPLSPPLSAETQSSLLSVGMRVRKSVPEGYKTHKTMPTEAFPFPSTAPAIAQPALRPSYNTAASRELALFCGLHKVGGFSVQDPLAPPSCAPPAFQTCNGGTNMIPSLSMSQSSSVSTLPLSSSAPKTAKKRSYDDDAEDDVDAYFDEVEAE
jgi:hypothetical protein